MGQTDLVIKSTKNKNLSHGAVALSSSIACCSSVINTASWAEIITNIGLIKTGQAWQMNRYF